MIIPWKYPLVFKGCRDGPHSFFVAVESGGGGSIDLYVSFDIAVTSAPVSNLKFVARLFSPTVAIQLLLCSESTVSRNAELSIFSLVSSATFLLKQHEL